MCVCVCACVHKIERERERERERLCKREGVGEREGCVWVCALGLKERDLV